MSLNHKLTVEFREKGSGKGNNSKVSSLTNLKNRKSKKSENGAKGIATALKASRAIRTQDIGGAVGLFGNTGGFGIAMAVIQEINQWHNLYLDYRSAVTGETLHAGNLKKGKSYLLSFGTVYFKEAIENHLFTKNIVHRQNIQNQYYRDLYYYKMDGNQYGDR